MLLAERMMPALADECDNRVDPFRRIELGMPGLDWLKVPPTEIGRDVSVLQCGVFRRALSVYTSLPTTREAVKAKRASAVPIARARPFELATLIRCARLGEISCRQSRGCYLFVIRLWDVNAQAIMQRGNQIQHIH